MFDETTGNLALPLPHPENVLEHDVLRLRMALQMLDAEAARLAGLVTAGISTAGTAAQAMLATHNADADAHEDIRAQILSSENTSKRYVDAAIEGIARNVDTAIEGIDRGVSEGEPDTIMRRDEFGRAEIVAPSVAAEIANKGYVDTALSTAFSGLTSVPTGSVFWFAAQTPPVGYLECNGATLSRTIYADLFAVIDTTWGNGDGSTTFKIPDLRGEFIRGWDNGRGVDTSRAFAAAQSGANEAHTHTVSGYTSSSGNHSHSSNGYQAVIAGDVFNLNIIIGKAHHG